MALVPQFCAPVLFFPHQNLLEESECCSSPRSSWSTGPGQSPSLAFLAYPQVLLWQAWVWKAYIGQTPLLTLHLLPNGSPTSFSSPCHFSVSPSALACQALASLCADSCLQPDSWLSPAGAQATLVLSHGESCLPVLVILPLSL